MRRPLPVVLCLAFAGLHMLGAETGTTATAQPAPDPVPAPSVASSEDLKQLRARIAQQEEQIKRLQQAVNEQQKLLERSLAAMNASQVKTTDGTTGVVTAANSQNNPVQLVPAVGGTRPLVAAAGGGSSSGAAGQKTLTHQPSALSISIGDTTFSPLGFVDATFYGRSTNLGSGIGTNFAQTPYNNSSIGHLSEANFSTQNSRIGFRVDSTVLGAKVLGYFEADFLGNQPGNVYVTSNADTFRMRNVFVDVEKNGFEVLGGQDWSLMTPNRKGLSPLPTDIFYTQDMDTNYQAGLVWARQSQFRFVGHLSPDLTVGASLENPEQYAGGSAGAPSPVFPKALSTLASTQFNTGATNYAAPNLHPDIVFKGAYDGHVGDKIMHVEAAGLIRSFKFAAPLGAAGSYRSSTATAASGEVNANLEVAKGFRLIANTFFGSGNGRYVFGLVPDVVLRPNGAISPIHTYSTVDGFEATLHKNTLLYAYYGGVLAKKNTGFDADGKTPIGYGINVASVAASQNRAIQEGTLGVTQTLWKSPSYGALSLITQYSYLTRAPWYVPANAPKAAHTNMYWIDLRYTLP